MDEKITSFLVITGVLILLLGGIWMMSRLRGPLRALPKRGCAPLVLILLGVAIGAFGPVYNKLYPTKPDTRQVDSETIGAEGTAQKTTTIGRRKDVEKLKEDKTADRLQLNDAKLEITDDELAEIIAGRDNLSFIDLSDNPVTDASLERLVKMPQLTKLYAARTNFTAAGVKMFVLDNPGCRLTEIDFRGLTPPVAGKDLREWKARDQANRKFIN